MSLMFVSIVVGVIGASLTAYRIYLFKTQKPTYEDEIKANSIKLENCRRLLNVSSQNLVSLEGALKNSEEDIKVIEARARNTTDDDVLKVLFGRLKTLKETHDKKLAVFNAAKQRHDESQKEFKDFEVAICSLKEQVRQTQTAVDTSTARQTARDFVANQNSELSDLLVKANTADSMAQLMKPKPNEFEVAADQEDFQKWKSALENLD